MTTTNKSTKISVYAAIAIVIANMVGTGVFTSLGFQVLGINSIFALVMLWVVGGVIALTGALCYGELGAALPRSGGEYHLLSRIYHPSIGFLSGWLSATVGFAAPTALAAMALAQYTTNIFTGINTQILAALVVIILSVVHSFTIRTSSWFQVIVTLIKVVLIIFFIILGLTTDNHQTISLLPTNAGWSEMFSGVFAVSLVYVSFAYSGWNGSVYISSEISNPQRNIPLSLLAGTLIVMLLYVLLNSVFLYTAPIN